ncbi:MAG: hypothetical protein JEZ07_05790 [Phycisphaerae bacterium]|nr:hypothetical protein [Phycisphaerae bacterium]
MNIMKFLVVLVLMGFVSGCGDGAVIRRLISENGQLEKDKKQIQDDLAMANEMLAVATELVENLRALPADRLEKLVFVDSIELGRYTHGFDKNNDGIDEGVNIYLLLIDDMGDSIKAYGSVVIELWDLSAVAGQQLIVRHEHGIDEIRKYWISGVLNRNYKFVILWPDGKVPANKNITVKCKFVDAMTGRSFEVQKMVTVGL